MVKKVIGIISYFPEDENTRRARLQGLLNLLSVLEVFELPVSIIAQNWQKRDLNKLKTEIKNLNISIHFYPKLGIIGARRELRKKFLESDYDYLIMLDDDCKVVVNALGAQNYLAEIDQHPSGAGEFRNTLLKLYAISKDLLREIDFTTEVDPLLGTGFEDTIFVNKVRNKFPDKIYTFSCRGTNIDEKSLNARDPLSTWYTDQDLQKMLKRTHEIVDELKK